MKFLENIDYNNIDKGIEFLKTYKFKYYLSEGDKTIYHVYWYGKLKRKQICCINSYLKTQDLSNTKLWVWLDYKTFELSKDKVPKHSNIVVKKYIPNKESKGTLLEKYPYINQDKYLKFRSDIARVIFLYKYGGLYFDLDMILLKNLKPLLGIEFCYTWGSRKTGNNGILRIKKKSSLARQIMNKYINTVSPFNLNNQSFFLGYNHYIFTKDIDIMCFPSVMFDPCWILTDTKTKSKYSKLNNFDNFFKTTDENIDTFFDNQIFAYHWHSRSNAIIEKNSYFEKLENNIYVCYNE